MFGPLNPYRGMFADWHIDDYHATAPGREYVLWIGVSSSFMHDEDGRGREGKKQLLIGVGSLERWMVWRALQAEIRGRNRAARREAELVKQDKAREMSATCRARLRDFRTSRRHLREAEAVLSGERTW